MPGDPSVELSDGEMPFRALVEAAADVIQVLEPDGTTRYITPAAITVLGRPPQELSGGHFRDLLHPDDRADAERVFAQVVEGPPGTTYEVEARIQRHDGGVRWIHGSVSNRMDTVGLKAIVANWRDVTASHDLRTRLHHAATHDPLTNLANRALFTDHLDLALAAIERRPDLWAAVLFVDLDHFKQINDRLGHSAGDELLRQVAERLVAAVRPHDTVGRLGGDEFAVLCPDLHRVHEVEGIGRRIREAMSRPYELGNGEPSVLVSASIGVTVSRLESNGPDLLREADSALYEAKRRGRNRVEIFGAPLRATITSRLQLRGSLQHAIQTDQLVVHYQPKIDLATGQTIAAEALVRWQHPDRGLLFPSDFLDLAEETALIVPLGRLVLRTALEQAQTWEHDTLEVCVNVSPGELNEPTFVPAVAQALQDFGIHPGRLCLEVTESAAVYDIAATAAILAALRDLGVHVALDDFGTGYSSLTWLQRLPVDSLKLDQTFTARLVEHPPTAQIVGAVLALARVLGLVTVGEGVETAEQLARLTELGCDQAQGNLIGRPVPPAELVLW